MAPSLDTSRKPDEIAELAEFGLGPSVLEGHGQWDSAVVQTGRALRGLWNDVKKAVLATRAAVSLAQADDTLTQKGRDLQRQKARTELLDQVRRLQADARLGVARRRLIELKDGLRPRRPEDPFTVAITLRRIDRLHQLDPIKLRLAIQTGEREVVESLLLLGDGLERRELLVKAGGDVDLEAALLRAVSVDRPEVAAEVSNLATGLREVSDILGRAQKEAGAPVEIPGA